MWHVKYISSHCKLYQYQWECVTHKRSVIISPPCETTVSSCCLCLLQMSEVREQQKATVILKATLCSRKVKVMCFYWL